MEYPTQTINKKDSNTGLNCIGNSPYTIKEAAQLLRMCEKSVSRQIDKGHLRRCKVFGRVLIPRKDVDTFIEKFSAFSF